MEGFQARTTRALVRPAFAMAFRVDPEGKYHGEITRKLDVSLKPGEEWKGREPAVIIFATDEVKPEEIYREAIGLRK